MYMINVCHIENIRAMTSPEIIKRFCVMRWKCITHMPSIGNDEKNKMHKHPSLCQHIWSPCETFSFSFDEFHLIYSMHEKWISENGCMFHYYSVRMKHYLPINLMASICAFDVNITKCATHIQYIHERMLHSSWKAHMPLPAHIKSNKISNATNFPIDTEWRHTVNLRMFYV